MKVFNLISICFISITTVSGQTVALPQLEAAFLSNNYLLIASKYDIEISEANIVQEKLWNNPTLHLSEVNLWKTTAVEEMPYLFGSFGKSQQFSVELEQLIETTGKRKKRVAIRELAKNTALLEYQELMQELLKTLRQTYYSMARVQEELEQLKMSVELFEQLDAQYGRQSALNNVSRADYYRIQAELAGLLKDKVALENEQESLLSTLRVLTQRPDITPQQIDFSAFKQHAGPLPASLKETVRMQNTTLNRQQNEILLAEKEWTLERAQRVPDLTLSVAYDRGGNIMLDFVGVGLSMDLPFFNNNKGGIKAAKIAYEREKVEYLALQSELDQTAEHLHQQLRRLKSALNQWDAEHSQDPSSLVESYNKHLLNQQVTLLEFIDFTQAYRASQTAYLELAETYHTTFEELNQLLGSGQK